MTPSKIFWPIIILLALLKFILPFLLQSPVFELQRDEFLYYEQGQHPAFGYLENPPLLSWLATISSWFGGSEVSIKFWACLFGSVTVVLTCLITAELGGGRFAQFIAGLGILTGAYVRVHFLFQPNVLDIFFWTLGIYFLVRYINTSNPKFIYALALALALGWWSKYSVLFIIAAIVIGVLLTQYRKIFTKKETWLASLLALIVIAPNVFWQYEHKWPLIHHMEELQDTQLRHLNAADFLKDQFLMLLPVIFVWITGVVWLLRNIHFRIIAYIYLAVIILLIAGSGKSYYSLGAYPMLLAAGGVAIEKWTLKRMWLRFALPLLIVILTLPFIPLLLPTHEPPRLARIYEKMGIEKTGLLKWEDLQNHALPQDFADMLGWKELATKAERFYNSLPDSSKHSTTIYGRHYGHAGGLKYYANDESFKRNVITDNGSFLLWIPSRIWFENLVFIGRRFPEPDDEVFQHFRKYTIIDSVTNPFSRQFGDKIIFFEDIDSTGLRFAIDGLQEMKNEFQRQ